METAQDQASGNRELSPGRTLQARGNAAPLLLRYPFAASSSPWFLSHSHVPAFPVHLIIAKDARCVFQRRQLRADLHTSLGCGEKHICVSQAELRPMMGFLLNKCGCFPSSGIDRLHHGALLRL